MSPSFDSLAAGGGSQTGRGSVPVEPRRDAAACRPAMFSLALALAAAWSTPRQPSAPPNRSSPEILEDPPSDSPSIAHQPVVGMCVCMRVCVYECVCVCVSVYICMHVSICIALWREATPGNPSPAGVAWRDGPMYMYSCIPS